MDERTDRTVTRTEADVASGCLIVLAGMCTGLLTWSHGARPGLHGDFEGQNSDLSLLYVELPLMLLGIPVLALAAWALARAALRGAGRGVRTGGALLAAVLALAALAWGCTAWLEHATDTLDDYPGM